MDSTRLTEMRSRPPAAGGAVPALASRTPAGAGLVRRRCSCGGSQGAAGECEECRRRRLARRAAPGPAPSAEAPPAVRRELRRPGRPLEPRVRSDMEKRFGHRFDGVRVHAGPGAAFSARAVRADAYTVGRDVVFAAGRYRPQTPAGARLLAHELAHVVQQGGAPAPASVPLAVDAADSPLERQAERAAAEVTRGVPPAGLGRGPLAVSREEGEGEGGDEVPEALQTTGCDEGQRRAIEDARRAAAIRSQIAMFRLRGTVPPGPPGREDPGEREQRRARTLIRRLFGEELNYGQVTEIVGEMAGRLTSRNTTYVCAPEGDEECGNRAGYVRGYRPPVHLCPRFFESSSPEQRIRTLVHEAAHLSGIGEAEGESYCQFYDCDTSCGGFDVADSWSHLVHCLSDQTPDEGEAVVGEAP